MIKTRNHSFQIPIFLIVFSIIVSGCQKVSHDKTIASTLPSKTATLIATSTMLPDTATPIPSATFTKTPRPTKTITPTPTNTWTPFPTLVHYEAQGLIEQLLTDNANCELPCVWGMLPGETSWHEAQQYLGSFMEYKGQGGGGTYSGTSFAFYYGSNKSTKKFDIQVDVDVEKYLATGFDLYPPGTAIRYSLDQILMRYGSPESIYIHTYPSSPIAGKLPFDVFLYYPEYGFSAFFSFNAKKIEEELQVCPKNQQIGPALYIWDPTEEAYSLEELYSSFFEDESIITLSVEEALGISIEEFTNVYRNGETTECFTTPGEIWIAFP